jgi:hypothetical protein
MKLLNAVLTIVLFTSGISFAQTNCDLSVADCLVKGVPGPQGPTGPAGPQGPAGPSGGSAIGGVYDVTQNGVVADLIMVNDGVCSATTFSSATANFTPAAVGKTLSVLNCGPGGGQWITTIAGYVSPTTVTPATPASLFGPANLAGYGTDNTAAINALIAATTKGGTIFFPQGRYSFAGKINVPQAIDSITLLGVGGPLIPNPIIQTGPSTLTYLGTGSGHFLDIQSTQYATVRNLMLNGFAIGWTGFLTTVRNSGHGDPAHTLFDSVYFSAPDNASGLLLDTTIETNIVNSSFEWGRIGLQGVTSAAASSYANIVHMSGGQFAAQSVSAIFQAGESWSFDHVTFEPLRNGQGVVYTGTSGIPSQNLSFANCWVGDESVAGANTFSVYGNGFALTNNLITGGGTGDNAVLLHGNKGISITGNYFGGYSNVINYFGATVQGGLISGNAYHGVINFEIGIGNKDASVISTGNAAF